MKRWFKILWPSAITWIVFFTFIQLLVHNFENKDLATLFNIAASAGLGVMIYLIAADRYYNA